MSGIDFTPSLFANLLGVRGEKADVRLFKVRTCYCLDPTRNSHNPSHAACSGTGFLTSEQDISSESVWFAGVKPESQLVKSGALQIGDIFLLFDPEKIEITEHDYVVLTNRGRETFNNEILSHATSGGSDKLRFGFVTRLSRVYDATGNYIISATGDCKLGGDAQSVDWSPPGNEPGVGAVYGVQYWFSPTFKALIHAPIRRRSVGGKKLIQSLPMHWREADSFRS